MVTSIGSTGLAQAALAPGKKSQAEETASATPSVQTTESDSVNTGGVETQSALSSATARLGDQLDAQANAARVDRARAEAPPPPPDGPPPAEGSGETEEASAPAGAPPAGARPAGGGGGAAASRETESADYIAEADTNSDKKVSDEERIAYEKKLEQQAQDKSGAVQKAYGLVDESAPAVSVTA